MEDATSCIELLLTSFCKHFRLKPKQAAGLMSQKAKYLTHIIVKGLRGRFEPIVGWYQDLYAHLSTIVQLVQRGEGKDSLPFILTALRPGLVSRSIEVTIWTCRLLSKLGAELRETDVQSGLWEVRAN
jgi:hypothetical protein